MSVSMVFGTCIFRTGATMSFLNRTEQPIGFLTKLNSSNVSILSIAQARMNTGCCEPADERWHKQAKP